MHFHIGEILVLTLFQNAMRRCGHNPTDIEG